MRTRQTSAGGLTVQAVAGTFVVLLGFSVADQKRKGLLGFALHRADLTENEAYWLPGGLAFPGIPLNPQGGVSTLTSPIQKFRWGDYTAKPSHQYQYQVQAMYGTPGALVAGDSVTVNVQTEDPLHVGDGKHQVHFNRSAAASQAYVHMFGNADPQNVPDGAAFRWLSRGLEESLIAFIGRAVDETYSLYLSIYEFQKDSFLDALSQAIGRKAHVEIIYDAIPGPTGPRVANEQAIQKHQLGPYCHGRSHIPSISHHKFMVLTQNNQPLAVWTGSTNFTDGAIYGQANVGHAVEDAALAAQFLQLHQQLLSKDPDITISRKLAEQLSPVPPPPAQSQFYPIFSPRTSLVAIDICARLIHNAQQLVCFTAPFGLDQELNTVLDDKTNRFLAFGLLNTADNKIEATNRTSEDRFVSPAQIQTKLDEFQAESLHHKGVYIHTKSIMIDPFSAAPIVVTGSANFSRNSSENNDENQFIISNQPAVSDVYVGEFMRMYDHYLFRDLLARTGKAQQDIHLSADDTWTDKYYVAGPEQQERLTFAGQV